MKVKKYGYHILAIGLLVVASSMQAAEAAPRTTKQKLAALFSCGRPVVETQLVQVMPSSAERMQRYQADERKSPALASASQQASASRLPSHIRSLSLTRAKDLAYRYGFCGWYHKLGVAGLRWDNHSKLLAIRFLKIDSIQSREQIIIKYHLDGKVADKQEIDVVTGLPAVFPKEAPEVECSLGEESYRVVVGNYAKGQGAHTLEIFSIPRA